MHRLQIIQRHKRAKSEALIEMMCQHDEVLKQMHDLTHFQIAQKYDLVVRPLESVVLVFHGLTVANKQNIGLGMDFMSSGGCVRACTHTHHTRTHSRRVHALKHDSAFE